MDDRAPTEKERREASMGRLNRSLEALGRQADWEEKLKELRGQPWFQDLEKTPGRKRGAK